MTKKAPIKPARTRRKAATKVPAGAPPAVEPTPAAAEAPRAAAARRSTVAKAAKPAAAKPATAAVEPATPPASAAMAKRVRPAKAAGAIKPAQATSTVANAVPASGAVAGERPAAPTAAPRRKKARGTAIRSAKFSVGQVVKHRFYPFRGVIFDIDPVFNNTEEWWQAIPEEIRPRKDQPFYHLLAENAETEYIAYVSEQNLLADDTKEPLRHPKISELFQEDENGQYRALFLQAH